MTNWKAYPPPGTPISQLRLAAAGLVVDDRGRLLLQRRSDNGYWAFPGGGVEPGESVTQAVEREVLEETGYRVRVERLLGVYSDPALHQLIQYPDGRVVHIVAVAFVCSLLSRDAGLATHAHEATETGWFEASALPEPMAPNHVIRLRDYLSGATESFIR